MAQYDIFLSFADADSTQVNLLIDRLGRDIPGIRIFHDSEGVELSEFERTRIIKAIDDSTIVVFALSENSLADLNCEKEVMYAKNTAKRVVPYLLPGMTLKGWLLYELGRINCVDSTNEEDVARFIDTLRQKLGYTNDNQREIPNQTQSDFSSVRSSISQPNPSQTHISQPNPLLPDHTNSIETQLVFDHRTGEFVSRTAAENQDKTADNTSSEYTSSSTYSNADEPSLEQQKKLYINGHEYVDLGLPSGLKWAACNLGAYRMEDSGTYYAWGEIKPKAPFFPKNSQTYLKDTEWLKSNGYLDDKGNLTLFHDAAHKEWGRTWRMPTKDEFEELQSNTTSSWHRVNGIDGYMLKSKINGQCVFFPAFGRKGGLNTMDNGVLGMYWSSTVGEDNATEACRAALGLNLFSLRETARFMGLSIRPVSE